MVALVTRHFRIHNAIQFFESFNEPTPTKYYFFIGKSFAYANVVPITGTVKTTTSSNVVVGQGTYFTAELSVGDRVSVYNQPSTMLRVHAITSGQTFISTTRPANTIIVGANAYIRKTFSELSPPTPTDSYQDTYYDIWRNMISVKKINPSDVTHVATRYNWANATVYTEYDDRDAGLETKTYYVFTEDRNVYKCIDNNRGAISTDVPTGTGTSLISTGDGYRWKYMYTVATGDVSRFVTPEFIPVKTLTANDGSSQWNVQQNAKTSGNGAIFHVKVIANGSGYLHEEGTFAAVSNTAVFRIDPSANSVDGVFTGSGIFISSGLGSGQYRRIVKYYGSNTTLVVNNAFTITPNTSSTYVISPLVRILGDSGTTVNSRAFAYVSNTYLGQVRTITIINFGRAYSTANVTITANNLYGFGAVGRPIISPVNGHGSDPVDELYGTGVLMSVTTTGSQSNTFPTNNDFRIIGIVRDPLLNNGLFANATVIDQSTRIGVNAVTGDFTADEVVVGQTTGVKARVVYFANSNNSRTAGTLKLIRVTTDGIGKTFTPGEIITGQTSSVTANVVSYTAPALKPYSGIVIYTENREPVTRTPAQSEEFRLVVRY